MVEKTLSELMIETNARKLKEALETSCVNAKGIKLDNFLSKLLDINTLEKKSIDIEKKSGVYFLYDNEELVYVGQTDYLSNRLLQHKTEKNFDEYSFYPIDDKEEKNLLEWFYIKKFKPRYNVSDTCKCHIKLEIGNKYFYSEEIFVVLNEYYEKSVTSNKKSKNDANRFPI